MTKPLGFYMNCPIAPELAGLEAQANSISSDTWVLLCAIAANQASLSSLNPEGSLTDDYSFALDSRYAISNRVHKRHPSLAPLLLLSLPTKHWLEFLAWCNSHAMNKTPVAHCESVKTH